MNTQEHLVYEYVDETRQGTTWFEYWDHDGTPVELKVHYDPYPQQCYGAVSRWTERNGYERVVTAEPNEIHEGKADGLVHIVIGLRDAYTRLFPW